MSTVRVPSCNFPWAQLTVGCMDCKVKRANFGMPDDRLRRWCGTCARAHEGAIDVVNKRCEDCQKKRPNFGMPGERKARWCHGCSQKHPGAENVVSKRCEDCKNKQPSYGMPHDNKQRWCQPCSQKHPGSVNLVGKKKGSLAASPKAAAAPMMRATGLPHPTLATATSVQPVAVIAEKAVGAAIAIAPAAHAVQTQGLGFPSAGSKRSAPFPVPVEHPPEKRQMLGHHMAMHGGATTISMSSAPHLAPPLPPTIPANLPPMQPPGMPMMSAAAMASAMSAMTGGGMMGGHSMSTVVPIQVSAVAHGLPGMQSAGFMASANSSMMAGMQPVPPGMTRVMNSPLAMTMAGTMAHTMAATMQHATMAGTMAGTMPVVSTTMPMTIPGVREAVAAHVATISDAMMPATITDAVPAVTPSIPDALPVHPVLGAAPKRPMMTMAGMGGAPYSASGMP